MHPKFGSEMLGQGELVLNEPLEMSNGPKDMELNAG
jgi:hypothetical protein